MRIVRAKAEDASALTEIAFAAKRHWGYPEPWMARWTEQLTIEPEFIATHETYVAILENSPVAFYALGPKEGRMELRHLWVSPAAMGRGIGRTLFRHALERVRELGFSALEIESDPNAEGFYLRLGARRVGYRKRESTSQDRELPILVCQLDQMN